MKLVISFLITVAILATIILGFAGIVAFVAYTKGLALLAIPFAIMWAIIHNDMWKFYR